jgi:hypothetical protein
MKRLALVASLVLLWLPGAALASAPGLQVSPLLYEDTLGNTAKSGHIDVANPTDAKLVVDVRIQAFRQHGTGGDLEFYDDEAIAAGVQTDLQQFELAPRGAVRVLFTVDPAKLPKGGVFAAIFFRTQPTAESNVGSSYVSESANVGTLLVLRNGNTAAYQGGITGVNLPFWQFGDGLRGQVAVANRAATAGGTAFRPQLSTQVLPLGSVAGHASGLILPGNTRRFDLARVGAFAGLLPVQVSDHTTHTSRTVWVLAVTGYWRLALPILALLIGASLWWAWRRRRRHRVQPVTPELQPDTPAEVAPEPPVKRPWVAPSPRSWERAAVPQEARVAVTVKPAHTPAPRLESEPVHLKPKVKHPRT